MLIFQAYRRILAKMKQYQSILIDMRNMPQKDVDFTVTNYFAKYHDLLSPDGTLWIFANARLTRGELDMVPFSIVGQLPSYSLKNIIIIPNLLKSTKRFFFEDCVDYLLFLSKNEQYFFNKDPIREKHIWKDVEWGRRNKNYHPLGKDPGNVWIKTQDDGHGKIIKHVGIDFSDAVSRVIKCSTRNGDNCLVINSKSKLPNLPGVRVDYA